MGCASSKRMEAKVDVYRPPPTSFAVFDINSIQEPWLVVEHPPEDPSEKPSNVPAPLLEKLNKIDSVDSPQSWVEVSKALEDLKPAIDNKPLSAAESTPEKPVQTEPNTKSDPNPQPQKLGPGKSFSFHTIEELDAKLSPKPKPGTELKKTESMRSMESKTESRVETEPKTEVRVGGKLKDNIFILRDRQEREKEGKMANYDRMKRDPLSEFPEMCPPGGADSLVLYTTSLGGVRRTYEECNRARAILEFHRAVFDERDVALHCEYLGELKELLGDGATVPRLFVKGRYLGGAEELVELNDSGRFRKVLDFARVERGLGRQACEGCGGARFVPCLDCGGSCKVVVEDKKERCEKCNENGLVHCPLCA